MKTSETFEVRPADWDADRPALRAIREQVFILEQAVPREMEWDEFDSVSRHVLAESGGRAIGTGRLLPDGHIGRMAVLAAWRGQGVGSRMLEALLYMARTDGHACVGLNAQVRATAFYRHFGFEPQGEPFIEAGIPHVAMSRKI